MSGDDSDHLPVDPQDYRAPEMDDRVTRPPVPWEWFDAVGVYGAWALSLGLVALVGQQLVDTEDTATALAVQVLVGLLLLVLITTGWLSLRAAAAGTTRGIRRALGQKRPEPRDLVRGLGYGLAAFAIVQLGIGAAITTAIDVLGQEPPVIQEEVQDALQGAGGMPLLVTFAVAVVAPVAEELLFRGLLYQALAKRLPGWPAIGLSGLAFGLTHLEPFVIVLTFPLGMALAWMFRRYGTLVVPVVAHAVFNLIGVLVIRATG